MTVTPARLLVLVAVILFVVAALGVTLGSLNELDIVALGLGIEFASFLV